MTHTEIIAVKLFGWERVEPKPIIPGPPSRWYELGNYSTQVYDNGSAVGWTAGNWPDFADGSLRWYWIRRMEDSLAERGLLERYMMTLDGEFTVKASDPMPGTCITWQSFAMLRATAEQRVEAAVKVLEGVK